MKKSPYSSILPNILVFLTAILSSLVIISITIALPTAVTSASLYLSSHSSSTSASSAFCRTGALNYPLVAREEHILQPTVLFSKALGHHHTQLQSRAVAAAATGSPITPPENRLVLSRSLPSNFIVEPAVMAGIVGAVALGVAGLML